MSKRLYSLLVLGLLILSTAACETHDASMNQESSRPNNTRGEADTGQLGHASDTSSGTMHGQ